MSLDSIAGSCCAIVTDLPRSPATERNRGPILEQLQTLFADRTHILEIGSGTGQHAVYFAPELQHLRWQTSDRPRVLDGLRRWLAAYPAANLPDPVALDVDDAWPDMEIDGIFSANTAHIMSWRQVCVMFVNVARCLLPGGRFVLYGPFAFEDVMVESNARFHANLRQQQVSMGIRGYEALDALAAMGGLEATSVIPMPANNHLLVWDKAGNVGK